MILKEPGKTKSKARWTFPEDKTMEMRTYRTRDAQIEIPVRFQNKTAWLSQAQMGELFSTTANNISQHIQSVFQSGELNATSVVQKFCSTATDGKEYQFNYYALDMIISVGYRANPLRITPFRHWADLIIKERQERAEELKRRGLLAGDTSVIPKYPAAVPVLDLTWFWFINVFKRVDEVSTNLLQQHGFHLTPDMLHILILLEEDEAIPQWALAAQMGKNKKYIYRAINHFVTLGYVQRVPYKAGAQQAGVVITEEGTAMAEKAKSLMADFNAQIFARFGTGEHRKAFQEDIEAISEALDLYAENMMT